MGINKIVQSLRHEIAVKNPAASAAAKANKAVNQIVRTIRHFNGETHRFEDARVVMIEDASAVMFKRVKNTKGKIEKIPIYINLATSQDNYRTFYYFLEPVTNKEIGYVAISDWRKVKDSVPYKMGMFDEGLIKDYIEQGVIGDRVSIDYVKNNMEELYSGAGSLADRLALEYCLRNKLKPQVTLTASENAHSAHFQRGYRFFPEQKSSSFDANKTVASRILNTKCGEKVYTRNLGNLYMYMPKNVIEQHLFEISRNPVLR